MKKMTKEFAKLHEVEMKTNKVKAVKKELVKCISKNYGKIKSILSDMKQNRKEANELREKVNKIEKFQKEKTASLENLIMD